MVASIPLDPEFPGLGGFLILNGIKFELDQSDCYKKPRKNTFVFSVPPSFNPELSGLLTP